jgi:SAM-dependent methyltransferase
MAIEDARRWNERYRNGYIGAEPRPRAILELARPYMKSDGLVLDLAMGLGANARWLVERGFHVLGVDISSEAVFRARKSCPQIMAVIADLNDFILPEQSFDAVLNFYFLDRAVLRNFPRILRPGGIAIVETLTMQMLDIKPELPPENLLNNGELPGFFSNWRILHYQEEWQTSDHGGQKSVASLIAQFPG